MYPVFILLSVALTLITARLDRYMTLKYDGDVEQCESWDLWFHYYNGRKNFYKILLVGSFVPALNEILIGLLITVILILIIIMIIRADFWSHGFWDKLF